MNEPRRLIDDSPSELESALLRAGRDYRASATTHTKTLAALGLASSATLLAKSSAAASLWSLKGLLVGGAVVGVVATGVVLVRAPAARPDTVPAELERRDRAAIITPTTPKGPAEESAAPPEALPEDAAEPAAPNPARTPVTPSRAASITAELQAIDAARSALAAGNGARALALLDEHARRFPGGRLHLEAEVLRIEALARSGQGPTARTRARAFVERHPNSVFTPRIKRLAGE